MPTGCRPARRSASAKARRTTSQSWLALVALGVISLAIAPKPKAAEASAPALVTLTDLTDEGRAALGCAAKTVNALKVTGDDKSPTVITLPGGECPVRAVKFLTQNPKPLGKVTEVKVVEAK